MAQEVDYMLSFNKTLNASQSPALISQKQYKNLTDILSRELTESEFEAVDVFSAAPNIVRFVLVAEADRLATDE